MQILFVDSRKRGSHLREQLRAAGSITFEVDSLDVVERLEPCHVHGVCLVLERGPDALEPIRDLRARAYTGPLVALGAGSTMAVLQAGADDLQALEVQGAELLARLESIRRTSGPFVAGPIVLDPVTRRVWLRERELLDIGRGEVDMLACLLRRPGYPVHIAELARAAGGDLQPDTSFVHAAIERLRRLLPPGCLILEKPGERAYSFRPDDLDAPTRWWLLNPREPRIG